MTTRPDGDLDDTDVAATVSRDAGAAPHTAPAAPRARNIAATPGGSRDGWSPPAEMEEYVLVKPLGRGAMGQVYLAHDTLLDRKVAVKFIADGADDPALREQFFVEARAIARLNHPNVVAIHRVGEIRRRPYLVSEFVHGMTLAELPKPVASPRLVEIGVGLARGLAAAHRRGVLHRDLKPANAMITDEGEVKLLDFGLAKLLDRAPRGLDGDRVGSPLYMAPEIWRGEPASRASDVYSIGVFLYELASGKPPHDGKSIDELMQLTQTSPRPLSEMAPAIEPRLGQIIDRCLRRDPAARFDSGDALREALEALVVGARAAAPAGSPYPGLSAFDANHRGLFFGRDAEARAILDRLRSDPLVVVAGDSGVGKSSLLRAGVLPQLTARSLQLVPGRRPLAALCAVAAPLAGMDEAKLQQLVRADPSLLGRLLRPHAPLVVLVDQLEELVTLSDGGEAAAACEALAALTLRVPGLQVLATARSDFLTRLAALPALGPELARALYLAPPLSAEGVRDAIVGPARAMGFDFESAAMIDALVAVAAEAGGLPLLQFALAKLWDARDVERRIIPAAALEQMGGPAGALARHADGVLAAMLPTERAAAEQILLSLTTAEGTRARRGEADLVGGDAVARSALEALVRGRLVVAREESYEIAHEALVTRWDQLRSWLTRDGERRAVLQRIERAAAEWERLGRAPEALWSEKQLGESAVVPPGAREQAFIAESRRATRRRRVRRWILVAAAPAVVLGAYGITSLLRARETAHRVATLRDAAVAAHERSRAGAREFESLRAAALDRFDHLDPDAGEARWHDALAAAHRAMTDARSASDALETALRIDAARADVRALFADLLVERARLADALFQRESRDEILVRLALNDEDGSRRAAWNAPGEVELVAPAGVPIALFRYEDDDGHRRAVPLPPPTAPRLTLAPGSYLAVAGEVRLPFVVDAGEHLRVALEPPARPVPPGFVYVPPGRFLYGWGGKAGTDEMRRNFFSAPPLHQVETGPFFIARNETTWSDWTAFVEALPGADREELLPRASNFEGNGVMLQKLDDDWELTLRPKAHVYRARWGEPIRYRDRNYNSEQDWRKMPVSAVSFRAAERYARWLDQTGRVPGARICTEVEWERAARGADDREYPHGDRLAPGDADFDISYGQKLDAFGPDEVGRHPASRSPFGVDDLVGNIFEWTRSSTAKDEVTVRGGCFYYDRDMTRVYYRERMNPSDRTAMIGVRICASAR